MSGATPFIYLLNRMENAASAKDPSKAGYGGHRKAVLDHVAKAESDLAEALAVLGEILAHHVTLNERAGRPICRSHTIKLCDGVLSKHAKGS